MARYVIECTSRMGQSWLYRTFPAQLTKHESLALRLSIEKAKIMVRYLSRIHYSPRVWEVDSLGNRVSLVNIE